MILDKALELAAVTSGVTASAATTNYIDFDLTDPNKGTETVNAELVFIITTTGVGTGTVNFALQDDTASGFSTALRTLASAGAAVATTLTKGTVIRLKIPAEHKRFIRGYLTVAGTVSALTYSAYVTHSV